MREGTESGAGTAMIPYHERTLAGVLADRAARYGDKPFLLFEDRCWSYAAFLRDSRRIANALAVRGVGFGSHVALMMDNRPELLLTYFALGALGAVAVPLNTAAKGELLAYYLTQSDSTALILEAGLLPRVAAVAGSLSAVGPVLVADDETGAPDPDVLAVLADAGCALEPFGRLYDGADAAIDRTVRASDLCLLMYSSGTTGRSKASMASHCCALSHGCSIAGAFGYGPDDVFYVSLPAFHGNAWYCGCLPALVAGGTIALARRFSVSRFWEDVKRTGATQFNLLGAMTGFLWSRPPDGLERSHRVRQAMVIPRPADQDAFEERFGVTVTSLFGLTDAGIVSASDPCDRGDRMSAGRPCPDVEVRILDDEDMPLPAGAVGEIALRGRVPWLFPTGYYKMPEATASAWRNLWFHTGDRGFLDDQGRLHFSDRKKDAIRRRGENISCFEVERIVGRMPGVAVAAAYPVASEYGEDEVALSIVPSEAAGPEAADVVAFCRENMPYFMVPRFVEIVAELPMTMSGKVEKYKLRDRAQADPGRLWDREKAGIRVSR